MHFNRGLFTLRVSNDTLLGRLHPGRFRRFGSGWQSSNCRI
jgi:hypothetical protein